MLNDEVRQVNIERVLNQIEDRFASAFVAANVDVFFQVWGLSTLAVRRLDVHCLEEQLNVLLKACLDTRSRVLDASEPVAAKQKATQWSGLFRHTAALRAEW